MPGKWNRQAGQDDGNLGVQVAQVVSESWQFLLERHGASGER